MTATRVKSPLPRQPTPVTAESTRTKKTAQPHEKKRPMDVKTGLFYLFAVVLLMLWLPDGLLSIPDKLRARRMAREASDARAAAASRIGAQP